MPKGVPTKTKTCPICGDEFLPEKPSQRYCKKDHYQPCPICGKPVLWNSMREVPVCSKECKRERMHRRNQEKYGVDHPMALKSVQEKHKASMKEHYGVDISDTAIRKAVEEHNEVCRIITEIGDISRFRTMGEFVSYCRLAPASKLSNGKSKGQGNAKNGNAYLSWALTELATLMARYNKSIQHYLERKVKKTGLRVIGIRALAAKLARCVYQVLRKKEAFDLLLAFGGSHPQEPSASRDKTEESSQRKTATKSSETKVTGMTRTVVTDKKKIPGKKPALAVTQTQRLKSAVGQKTASVASRLKAPCALTTTKPAYADRGCVKSRRE